MNTLALAAPLLGVLIGFLLGCIIENLIKEKYRPMWLVYAVVLGVGTLGLVSLSRAADLPKYLIISPAKAKKNLDLYIDGPIDERQVHGDNVRAIKNAKDGDKITIYINSPGGAQFVMDKYIEAIKYSKACVTADVRYAASAAFRIAARSHRLTFKPNALFMHHLGSCRSYFGDTEYDCSRSQYANMLKRLKKYYFIFNWKERVALEDGQDLWITGGEINKRTKYLPKIYNKLSGKNQDIFNRCLKRG